MNAITVLRQDAQTVTLSRDEFERVVAALEDRIDLAAVAAQEERERLLGKEAARADYLPAEAVRRIFGGESPVRVWREHRGMTQRALADAAGINAAYLSEIEAGKKPGSARALLGLARALGLDIEELLP